MTKDSSQALTPKVAPHTLKVLSTMSDLPLFSSYHQRQAPRTQTEAYILLEEAAYQHRRTISKLKITLSVGYIDAESKAHTHGTLSISYIPRGTMLPRVALVHAMLCWRDAVATPALICSVTAWMLRELLEPLELSVSVKPSALMGAQEVADYKFKSDMDQDKWSLKEEVLRVYLGLEVPKHIDRLKAGSKRPDSPMLDEATEHARTMISDISNGGQIISEDSIVLRQFAETVAVAAFYPGGMTFCGLRFEAEPLEMV